MGRASKAKGAAFEREVAGLFREGGYRASREGWRQSRDKDEPDVGVLFQPILAGRFFKHGGEVVEHFEDRRVPIHVECKRQEKLSLDKAVDQAKHAVGYMKNPQNLDWVVVHKKSRRPTLVTVDWSFFIELLRAKYPPKGE